MTYGPVWVHQHDKRCPEEIIVFRVNIYLLHVPVLKIIKDPCFVAESIDGRYIWHELELKDC